MSLLEPRAVLPPDLELLHMKQIKSLRVAKRFLTVTSTNETKTSSATVHSTVPSSSASSRIEILTSSSVTINVSCATEPLPDNNPSATTEIEQTVVVAAFKLCDRALDEGSILTQIFTLGVGGGRF
ncbi:hypothetical protein BDN67DRAFT_1001044 [Paxillus ammoniavirescens]|nr:hypothetical protein BDN67DRAFT_1001044 [Paxillus ammoniavirescens]